MDFMLNTTKKSGEVVPFACGPNNKCKGCKTTCKGCRNKCKGCTGALFIG